jgi:hypothetical protein
LLFHVNIILLRRGITFFRGIAIPEGIDNLFKKNHIFL